MRAIIKLLYGIHWKGKPDMNTEYWAEAWAKFAAAALQALVPLFADTELAAKHAAKYADAMMKEWGQR